MTENYGTNETPNFPDELSGWPLTTKIIEEMSSKIQVDPAMVFNTLAGCASVAVSASHDVDMGNDIVLPTSLFLITIAESGERKTTVFNKLRKVIYDFEKEKNKPENTDFGR